MATYALDSPYYGTLFNNKYLDVINFRSFPFLNNDIRYSLEKTFEHRPDLLAYKLYNNSNLWWVFAVRNPTIIKDPIFDFSAGTVIFLPQLTTLKSALGI
jgi:hypothetical protein